MDEAMTTLAFLEQMLNEEEEKERRDVIQDFSTKDAIYTIIMIIKERYGKRI